MRGKKSLACSSPGRAVSNVMYETDPSQSTLGSVEHHAGVDHVQSDVQYDRVAVVSMSVLRVDPGLRQRQRQRLLPEHQLLTGVFAVQQTAHRVPELSKSPVDIKHRFQLIAIARS